MSKILEGRAALVTGGGQGVGQGIARALAQAGANVVIAQRGVEQGEEEAAYLRDTHGVDATFIQTDVTKREVCAFTLESVVSNTTRTGEMKVNPYQAFDPLPREAILRPAVDRWADTQDRWLPPRVDGGGYLSNPNLWMLLRAGTIAETKTTQTIGSDTVDLKDRTNPYAEVSLLMNQKGDLPIMAGLYYTRTEYKLDEDSDAADNTKLKRDEFGFKVGVAF